MLELGCGDRGAGVVLGIAIFVLGVLAQGQAAAERLTGTATRIENDTFGSSRIWGRSLVLPEDGTIVRVMDGTYGFQILDEQGQVVGDFLFPEQAVGFSLSAGTYHLKPLVCRVHRHHHVEVTIDY